MVFTTAELAKYLSTQLYTIKYQRRYNKLPFFRQGIRVRYRLSDIETWLTMYKAIKEWKENLIFLREIGTQGLEVIPKVFYMQPIWRYLFYSEIFGSPCHRENDDPTIKLFFNINYEKLIEGVLTPRERKIFMHRIRLTEENTKIRIGTDEMDPLPQSFQKIRQRLNEKSKQVLHRIYRRSIKKLAIAITKEYSNADYWARIAGNKTREKNAPGANSSKEGQPSLI